MIVSSVINAEKSQTRLVWKCIYHHRICQHLITVRLQNAEGVPPENSQRHSLEHNIVQYCCDNGSLNNLFCRCFLF